MTEAVISVLIDLPPTRPYHLATVKALVHASAQLEARALVRVIPTQEITDDIISAPGDGVVVGPGSPYANPEGVHQVIRSARERGVPLVGT